MPVLICGTMAIIDYRGDIRASKALEGTGDSIKAILLCGSWNRSEIARQRNGDNSDVPRWVELIDDAWSIKAASFYTTLNIKCMAACVAVDSDEESTDICVNALGAPSELPSLLFIGTRDNPLLELGIPTREPKSLRVEHVQLNGSALDALLTRKASDDQEKNLISSVGEALSKLIDKRGYILPPQAKATVSKSISISNVNRKCNEPAIRIFIAGDRSQVGKSSICLGLLGALLNSGKYEPDDLAYIKPATQCEQTQLVEQYSKHKGITACVPIGPIVYYKGFTRAFLKGETSETSDQLLQKAGDAVDKLAMNKKVVIIDGVGYPAVGSITGTDNASVAKACGRTFSCPRSGEMERSPVPVLLIGKSGVGDAVDSFNINATYFAHRDVPVIGAIFNKLSLDGFYSLENCKEAVESYFRQYQPDRTAFGFIPEIPSLKNARENLSNKASEEEKLKYALEAADVFVEEFTKRVNVDLIVRAAKDATSKYMTSDRHLLPTTLGSKKRPAEDMANAPTNIAKHPRPASSVVEDKNNNSMNGMSLTRQQIEALASAAGAAGG